MARLSFWILGPARATVDGIPIQALTSRKAWALLAYLLVEAGRPHDREALAGRLWPERAGHAALRNLRHLIFDLRKALAEDSSNPPLLLIDRDTLQVNPDADYYLDVAEFGSLLGLASPTPDQLERAAALYLGPFLEDFSAGDSVVFEEWVVVQRERFHREVLGALHSLAAFEERQGAYERAEVPARRQLELEPWREEAHQQLMRLMALSGRRTAALAQFETCKKVLRQELGVQPSGETRALYEAIRDGKLGAAPWVPDIESRPYARTQDSTPTTHHAFVAREAELSFLERALEEALRGSGRVLFVVGEAGSGKSALTAEFAHRAMDRHEELVAVFGSSNAQTGIGDPYLPFREALQMLTSDIEGKRARESISSEHARRLWALLPEALRALIENGPDLVDLLVPGRALLARAQVVGPTAANQAWLPRLEKLLQRRPARSGSALQQNDLIEQVTRVLLHLARYQPLVIILDDLQWADRGSISLLFHLGRRLAGSRTLVVGAYRPCEVAMGRGGERHPLEPVVHELARDFGEMLLDLDQADGRRFVEESLDSEPNRLGEVFRENLYRHTGGHALFTVELLRGLEERGDLLKDEQGRRVEGPSLDWERLPSRVEAVIAERVGRLPREQQAVLEAAGVEGEEFTAEVAARVVGAEEETVARLLSRVLTREHRLLSALSLERQGGQRLSRYRFRHHLFQHFLYGRLDEVERARLHEEVGTALEGLYGERARAEKALELAHHFEEAGMPEKAVAYLILAAHRAAQLCAWEEEIGHLGRALSLLGKLPEAEERARQELAIHMALGGAIQGSHVWGTPERTEACERAYQLCQQAGAADQMVRSLFLLADVSKVQGQIRRSLEIAEQMLGVAQREADPDQLVLAHYSLGETLFFLGELAPGRRHLDEAMRYYDPGRHASLTSLAGADIAVAALTWASWDTLSLGFPEQAQSSANRALALANDFQEPLSLAFALALDGVGFELLSRDYRGARARMDELAALVADRRLEVMRPWLAFLEGRLLVARGEVEKGFGQMRQATDAWQANGPPPGTIFQLLMLADASLQHERWSEAERALDEATRVMERIDERGLEAELHRLRGELLSSGTNTIEAEMCFRQAIEVARRQEAKLWELRAATSLARLWAGQGRQQEARDLLAPIYNWFTEGFDTPDLVDARKLLADL